MGVVKQVIRHVVLVPTLASFIFGSVADSMIVRLNEIRIAPVVHGRAVDRNQPSFFNGVFTVVTPDGKRIISGTSDGRGHGRIGDEINVRLRVPRVLRGSELCSVRPKVRTGA